METEFRFTVEEFNKEISLEREVLFLEENGFVIIEDTGHQLMAKKETGQGIFEVFLQEGSISFSFVLISVIEERAFYFSTAAFSPVLDNMKVEYIEKKLNLASLLIKRTFLILNSMNCKVGTIGGSDLRFVFIITHQAHNFNLTIHIDPDNIRTSFDEKPMLFQITKEEIINKDIGFLSEKYTKAIETELCQKLNTAKNIDSF